MRTIALLMLLFAPTFMVNSQQFYVKPHVRYHTPLTFQGAPEYFNAAIIVSTNTGMYYTYIITRYKKFSLANGISYGADMGLKLSRNISLEFGTDYFQNRQEFISDTVFPYYPIGTTAWQFRIFNVSPGIAFSDEFGKLFLTFRASFITGLSSLGKSIIFQEKRKTYMFNKSLAYGYKFGAEAGYSMNKHFSISAEAGVQNIFYKPRKAILKQDDFSYWNLDELPPYLSRIRYVRKIDHEKVYYDKLSDTYYTGYNDPLKRLREAIKMNSFYAGISLTYNFSL